MIKTIYGTFNRSSKRRIDLSFDCEATEINLFHKLADFLKSEVMIDIGANIGLYSIYSAEIETIENIYSIEASRETFDELKANLDLQTSREKFRAFNIAASNREALLEFIEYGPMAGHNNLGETSFVGMRDGCKVVHVEAKRVDLFIPDRGRILAVKIDVEGHEVQVLEGAKELLRNSTGLLQIEVVRRENSKIVRDYLNELGWRWVAKLKNDEYFIHEAFNPILGSIHELIFESVSSALVLLQHHSTMRRRAIRACKEAGQIAEPIRRLISYKSDPVLGKR